MRAAGLAVLALALAVSACATTEAPRVAAPQAPRAVAMGRGERLAGGWARRRAHPRRLGRRARAHREGESHQSQA